jgi:hypothetical protein
MSIENAISADVSKQGFSLLTISDVDPPFACTVGLMFTPQHPELIIFGLREAGPDILRGMVKLMMEGRRFDSPDMHDIAGVLKIATRPVHPTQHEFYLGFAMGYCRERGRFGELQALQVFWPDMHGRFPFRPGCDEKVWAAQPRLDQPLTASEIRERRDELGNR